MKKASSPENPTLQFVSFIASQKKIATNTSAKIPNFHSRYTNSVLFILSSQQIKESKLIIKTNYFKKTFPKPVNCFL